MTNTPQSNPCGGFQFYLIPLLASFSAIRSWLNPWTSSLISLLAPLKVCTIMACDFFQPSPSSSWLNEFTKYVVLNENAISKCTALVVEHVNRHKYIIADTLRVILRNTTQHFANDLIAVPSLDLGRGAMICIVGYARLLSNTSHSLSQFFSSCRPSMT